MATTLVQATLIPCLDPCKNLLTAPSTFILVLVQHIPIKQPRAMYKFNHDTFILGGAVDFLLGLKWNPGTGMVSTSLHISPYISRLIMTLYLLAIKLQPLWVKFSFFRFQLRDPLLRDDFSCYLHRSRILPLFYLTTTCPFSFIALTTIWKLIIFVFIVWLVH